MSLQSLLQSLAIFANIKLYVFLFWYHELYVKIKLM